MAIVPKILIIKIEKKSIYRPYQYIWINNNNRNKLKKLK